MLHGNQRALFDLSFSIPSECADKLASGQADVGIVPSIELSRQKMNVIRGAGIACDGPVRSILLISKVPFGRIQRLAADISSRTSVMLSRIILARKYNSYPDMISARPDLGTMLDEADACLIIGDPALLLEPAALPFHVLDLGTEWTEWTGLPMVFAVWAARSDFPCQDPEPFSDSLSYGMDHLEDIVRTEHVRRGISTALARQYLTQHIRFRLGDREYAGLDRFLSYAADLKGLELSSTVIA
jgi:predicted solute-binding protein